eukprot:381982_1
MPIHCHSCRKLKNSNHFSRNQIKNHGNQRRCKECVKHGIKRKPIKKQWKSSLPTDSIVTQIDVLPVVCVIKIRDQHSLYVVLNNNYIVEICSGTSAHYMNMFETNGLYLTNGGTVVQITRNNGNTSIVLFPKDNLICVSRLDIDCNPTQIDHCIQQCKVGNVISSKFDYDNVIGVVSKISDVYSKQCEDNGCIKCVQNRSVMDKTCVIEVCLLNASATKVLKRFAEFGFDENIILMVTLKRCKVEKDGKNIVLPELGIVEMKQMYLDRTDLDVGYKNKRCRKKCAECHRMHIKLKVCKRCKCTYYCNRTCQKRSWNTKHRYYCLCGSLRIRNH